MGKILAICTSPKRGTVKTEVPSAVLTPEWGIVSDAHGGNWHRQVSLLSAEKIEAFRKKIWVDYGAFGENLVIEGFDFRSLPVTSRFAIGDVVLEMTQIGMMHSPVCCLMTQSLWHSLPIWVISSTTLPMANRQVTGRLRKSKPSMTRFSPKAP